MTTPQSLRQATTSKGIDRRLDDLHLEQVKDPRDLSRVDHVLAPLLKHILLCIMSDAGSARGVERRSNEIEPPPLDANAPLGRVADNTVSTLIAKLDSYDLRLCNAALIKKEKRRGRLNPSGGLQFHVVAVDGKCVSVWRWSELCRLTRLAWKALHQANPTWFIAPPFEVQDREPNVFEVYCLFKTCFHNVQLAFPKEGLPYGRLMVHRATLVSTHAAVGLLLRPIEGHTNEMGAIKDTLFHLLVEYGATDLCAMFVMDAGNTCLGAATQLVNARRDYFLRLKSIQGKIFTHAKVGLGDGHEPDRRPDLVVREMRGGKDVIYRVWQMNLPEGFGRWSHARQLVRVERLVVGDEPDDVSVGNRYYVCSKGHTDVRVSVALRLSRVYWRCENEAHWPADAILDEDTCRGRLSRHPRGVVVASWLRMIALNILSVLRSLSRVDAKGTPPCWREVLEYVREIYFRSRLDTTRFDAVEV